MITFCRIGQHQHSNLRVVKEGYVNTFSLVRHLECECETMVFIEFEGHIVQSYRRDQ